MYTGAVRGSGGLVAMLVGVLIVVGGSASASAATLRAEYRFQGDLASEVTGAPALANLGQGNRFALERIDGLDRQVLAFPEGNGLSLTTMGLVDPANHSVVVVFRLAETLGYRRIIDFTGGTSDDGLYNLNGKVVLYGGGAASQGIVLGDSFTQLTLTNAALAEDAERATAYVNGVEVATARASRGFDLRSGVLRFFQDNTSGPATGEEAGGAVSCILVYDGVLTTAEVRQVASDLTLCPAPRQVPGRPKVSKAGKPKAMGSGRSVTVDTGLIVSCPLGTTPCAARGRVDVASARGRAAVAKSRRLGAIGFPIPAGASESVQVRLSERGARTLREAGTLKVRVSAEITMAGARTARAQQVGTIEAPRPRAFRAGTYTGTTSQGLPIFVSVSRTAVRSAYFRWRGRCGDGKARTATVLLQGRARVRRGRFSLGGQLDTGGSARVSGRVGGVHAAGTLSRLGASIFGAKCATRRVSWRARATGVEVKARP